jgi:hypothetical protein
MHEALAGRESLEQTPKAANRSEFRFRIVSAPVIEIQ